MKIVFLGDSITDMSRSRETSETWYNSEGFTYALFVRAELEREDPHAYEIRTRGVSGNRSVDLYARLKEDCWNLRPDVISILIGVNDVWHSINDRGVELERYDKIYRMLLDDTKKVLPQARFMLLEPFCLQGEATQAHPDVFAHVKEYAAVAKQIAHDYGCVWVPLQKAFEEKAAKFGVFPYLHDGVHPNVSGARLIADEWLKAFAQLKK